MPTSGSFSDFPSNPSARRVVSQAFVPALNYYNNFAKDFPGTPPGTPNDDFALVATVTFTVDAGNHRFCTTSDDGSWLYIDGNLVVNNGGQHGDKSVCQYIWLSSGAHTATVNFFDIGGSAILYVSMDGSELPSGKTPDPFQCGRHLR